MASTPYICARCIRALDRAHHPPLAVPVRRLSQCRILARPADTSSQPNAKQNDPTDSAKSSERPETEKGPMARRLEEATEEALFTGGRAGRRAVEEAGFSDELKNKLLNKLADASFQTDNAAALSEAGLGARVPDSAGQGTRHIAASPAWTGEESHQDAVLRMLNDARKPLAPGLRGKPQIPSPVPVDLRLKQKPAVSAGTRAANARDKAEAYATMGLKSTGLTQEEREEYKKELRERFTPGARAMPNTLTGLASLANERWVLAS